MDKIIGWRSWRWLERVEQGEVEELPYLWRVLQVKRSLRVVIAICFDWPTLPYVSSTPRILPWRSPWWPIIAYWNYIFQHYKHPLRIYITSTVPCFYDGDSLLDLLGIDSSELLIIFYNIYCENFLNFPSNSQTLLELFLTQHDLLRILPFSVELHYSLVFLDHPLKNLHLCSLVKRFIIESFPRSFALFNHPLLNSIDLFGSGINAGVNLWASLSCICECSINNF